MHNTVTRPKDNLFFHKILLIYAGKKYALCSSKTEVPTRSVAFFFPWKRKIKVRLRQAVASNCPPDSCIGLFKSGRPQLLQKKKGHPFGCPFLEVPARFELANNGFADRGLTTWLRYHMK